MKNAVFTVAAAIAATGLGAQSVDALQARYDKKIAEDWVDNAAWVTDFDEARAAAKKSGKPIFAYFTRSYAP